MKTQVRKKRTTLATKQRATGKAADTKKTVAAIKSNEAYIQIPLGKIAFSPFNYRKYFSPKALEDFAQEIAVHGIISPITVRPLAAGKFELVAGERRVRAAKLARLKTVPAVVKTLSDEEVRETQLAENIQRENPHPLHEARAINDMLQNGRNVEEAALRLGKSKSYIYSRMKLAALIEPIQIMFLADKINIQQAFEIAKLSAEAQQDLFNEYCEDWENENFTLRNLGNILHHFHYDLSRAPFNIKDKKLLPEAGACSNCPFNSATLKTLFPEMAKQSVCSNKSCYQSKCKANLTRQVKDAFTENMPDAIVTYNGELSDEVREILEQNGAEGLPLFNSYDIGVISAPEEPDKEDYSNEDEDEETEFDESGYNEALQEYEEATQEYEELLNSGELKRGLHITGNEVETVYFIAEKKHSSQTGQGVTVTAKEVQEAIKVGKATPELLQAEIDRLNAREKRARELDAEKLQIKIHDQFEAFCKDAENSKGLTQADMVAARLLVFQNLNYSVRQQVSDFLFSTEMKETTDNNLFEMLTAITDIQFSYLIRMAITGKSESKSPNNIIGYSLYKMAEQAGLNVTDIEQEQEEKVTEREERLAQRIKDLNRKIEKLNKVLQIAQAS